MTEPIKNCMTCAHRKGSFTFGKCLVSGYHVEVERKVPQVCGRDFKAWQPRPSIFVRIKQFFMGVEYPISDNRKPDPYDKPQDYMG